ncbi:MAG: 50S ribosomal protein L17 [Ignavibacteria bacterium]|nr:50S ribosomal protein L17 [Ignavibacteria bacterium]
MVHRKKGRKLKRTASHRRALLANLSVSLILHKRIETTEAKAKELRRFIEPLVSKAKKALTYKDSAPEKGIHLRREARKFLHDKEALIILFDEIGARVGDRPGGYTRVLKKSGNRWGDGAKTAIIEFVDYNYVEKKEADQKAKDEVTDAKTDVKKSVEKETKKAKKESKKSAVSTDKEKSKTKKKKEESK